MWMNGLLNGTLQSATSQMSDYTVSDLWKMTNHIVSGIQFFIFYRKTINHCQKVDKSPPSQKFPPSDILQPLSKGRIPIIFIPPWHIVPNPTIYLRLKFYMYAELFPNTTPMGASDTCLWPVLHRHYSVIHERVRQHLALRLCGVRPTSGTRHRG